MSSWKHLIPLVLGAVLGAQSCDGTYFISDQGRVFVPRGRTVRLRIQGKLYDCTGCSGCVPVTEPRPNPTESRPASPQPPSFDEAAWKRAYEESLPVVLAQREAYQKERAAAREAVEQAFQRTGAPELQKLIANFSVATPLDSQALTERFRSARCDAWKALRVARQRLGTALGTPESIRASAGLGFDTPSEDCPPSTLGTPLDPNDPAWTELEAQITRLRALAQEALDLQPRMEQAQRAREALDQRLIALEQRYGRTFLTQIFGLADSRVPTSGAPQPRPKPSPKAPTKPPKLSPSEQADLEALAAQVNALERETQALEQRLDALEAEWNALGGQAPEQRNLP